MIRLARGLPEHLGQAHDGHHARADDVGQDLPRSNGWQLVDIADDQHWEGPSPLRPCSKSGEVHGETLEIGERAVVEGAFVSSPGADAGARSPPPALRASGAHASTSGRRASGCELNEPAPSAQEERG